jgi:HK97 gp10 family phage protein
MPFDLDIMEQVGADLEEKASRVPRLWAGRVVAHGQENAPVDTGYLRDHIVDASEGDEGAAESQADYSLDVNFGTTHQHANPYFTNAVEQANSELPDIVGEAF